MLAKRSFTYVENFELLWFFCHYVKTFSKSRLLFRSRGVFWKSLKFDHLNFFCGLTFDLFNFNQLNFLQIFIQFSSFKVKQNQILLLKGRKIALFNSEKQMARRNVSDLCFEWINRFFSGIKKCKLLTQFSLELHSSKNVPISKYPWI